MLLATPGHSLHSLQGCRLPLSVVHLSGRPTAIVLAEPDPACARVLTLSRTLALNVTGLPKALHLNDTQMYITGRERTQCY